MCEPNFSKLKYVCNNKPIIYLQRINEQIIYKLFPGNTMCVHYGTYYAWAGDINTRGFSTYELKQNNYFVNASCFNGDHNNIIWTIFFETDTTSPNLTCIDYKMCYSRRFNTITRKNNNKYWNKISDSMSISK